MDVAAHAALTAGNVAMGVVGAHQMSFGVWGEPTRRALELDAVAQRHQILLDSDAAERLSGDWQLAPIDHQLTLGREPIDAIELLSLRHSPGELSS